MVPYWQQRELTRNLLVRTLTVEDSKHFRYSQYYYMMIFWKTELAFPRTMVISCVLKNAGPASRTSTQSNLKINFSSIEYRTEDCCPFETQRISWTHHKNVSHIKPQIQMAIRSPKQTWIWHSFSVTLAITGYKTRANTANLNKWKRISYFRVKWWKRETGPWGLFLVSAKLES